MCNPAIAMFALTAASSAMQYRQQQNAAADQNAMEAQNRYNALAATRDSYAQMNERQLQETDAAGQAIQSRRLDETRQLSAARTAAGEAGITGFSVDALMRDISDRTAGDVGAIQNNLDWTLTQAQHQQRGIQSTGQSRINSVSRARGPSALAAGLQIASGGVNAYNYNQSLKKV